MRHWIQCAPLVDLCRFRLLGGSKRASARLGRASTLGPSHMFTPRCGLPPPARRSLACPHPTPPPPRSSPVLPSLRDPQWPPTGPTPHPPMSDRGEAPRGRRRIEAAELAARRARLAAVTMAERARELLDGKEFFEVPSGGPEMGRGERDAHGKGRRHARRSAKRCGRGREPNWRRTSPNRPPLGATPALGRRRHPAPGSDLTPRRPAAGRASTSTSAGRPCCASTTSPAASGPPLHPPTPPPAHAPPPPSPPGAARAAALCRRQGVAQRAEPMCRAAHRGATPPPRRRQGIRSR